MPKFYIFARKINEMAKLYIIVAPKWTKCLNFTYFPKIFFSILEGGGQMPPPVSYAYGRAPVWNKADWYWLSYRWRYPIVHQ